MSADRPTVHQRYPVDVSYMVADLKYNARDGVKICEIQQASLSLFNGDTYRGLPEEKSIHAELLRVLSSLNKKGWIVSEGMADQRLVAALARSPFWHNPKGLIDLFSDVNFTAVSKRLPADIYNLASYQGFIYMSWDQLSVIYDFESRLRGMIAMDKSSFPLWIDKYRMTRLFAQDGILADIKPKWRNYKKVYTKGLAAVIARDLQCDTFVIKPRGNFMGKGVIITHYADLDKVLRFIIDHEGPLTQNSDSAYAAWKSDAFDSFIVEEFVASDPIILPHVENKIFQPTMRVAFLLIYNNHKHSVHFLGEYWKTPELSIDEAGDFMHKHKDICKPPYYLAVDASVREAVQNKLRVALPLLHKRMLQFQSAAGEDFYAPINKAMQISVQNTAEF